VESADMLISISKHFLFVATLKTASTAIESRLRPYAEIAITQPELGKHLPLGEIADRFDWLFERTGLSEFFAFGVLRDPVDFMLSLYNSHRSPAFAADPHLFTGKLTFSQFVEAWVPVNAEQARPQHERLLGPDGRIGIDYVIAYENLRAGLDAVGCMIGIGPVGRLEVHNPSFGKLRRGDLRRAELDWIQDTYRQDILFRKQFCNRLLGRRRRYASHAVAVGAPC
jgi:hypothetical protein